MEEKKTKIKSIPNVKQLENELKRVKTQSKFNKLLKSTVYTLVVVAAVAILISVFFMPVIRIYGSSMEPTLKAGDIIVSVKTKKVKAGDIVGVYYGNKLLVKRVIATENQSINMDEDGNVYINDSDIPLEEPYVIEKSIGELDISLPYKVPQGTIFIMGDNRNTSADSRTSEMGCINLDDIAGKVIFRVWPFKRFGKLNIKK